MSDFDKEAERERLREKYEQEQADREVTQQMSELLLQGATMTNTHCDQCGNPIFRYDGQEFCPVCQGQVEAGEEAAEAEAEAAETQSTGQAAGTGAEQADAGTEPGAAASFEGEAGTTAGTPSVDGQGRRPPATADVEGDLREARASLVRTLTDLAGQAESAGDVRRRRDLLEAAREAAEAIEALDRASR